MISREICVFFARTRALCSRSRARERARPFARGARRARRKIFFESRDFFWRGTLDRALKECARSHRARERDARRASIARVAPRSETIRASIKLKRATSSTDARGSLSHVSRGARARLACSRRGEGRPTFDDARSNRNHAAHSAPRCVGARRGLIAEHQVETCRHSRLGAK